MKTQTRNREATVQPKALNVLRDTVETLEKLASQNPLLARVSEHAAQEILNGLANTQQKLESNVIHNQGKLIRMKQGSTAKADQIMPEKIREYCETFLGLVDKLEGFANEADKLKNKKTA